MLVAITPPFATDTPVPKALPPDELTVTSAVALIAALASAVTVTEPAVTVAFSMPATTAPVTALRTTTPPAAMESESSTFRPCGNRRATSTRCQ